jgi:hypothetical protein
MEQLTPIILWASGIFCAFCTMKMIQYREKNEMLLKKLKTITDEKNEIAEKLEPFIENCRIAVWEWKGWHLKNNPNKKWTITLRLKEVERSLTNSHYSRFEVLSHIASNNNGNDTTSYYSETFYKKFKGGWLDTSNNNKEFQWVSAVDVATTRKLKLQRLGIFGEDDKIEKNDQ